MSEQMKFDFAELHALIEQRERELELSRFHSLATTLHRDLVGRMLAACWKSQRYKLIDAAPQELSQYIEFLNNWVEEEKRKRGNEQTR